MKQGLGQALHDCDCEASSRHQIRRVNDASQTTVVGKSEEIFEVTSDRRQPPSSNTMVANCPPTIASHLLRGGDNSRKQLQSLHNRLCLPPARCGHLSCPPANTLLHPFPFSSVSSSSPPGACHLPLLPPAHLTPLCLSLPLHPPHPHPHPTPFLLKYAKYHGFEQHASV